MKSKLFITLVVIQISTILSAQQRQQKGQEFLYGPTIGYANQAGNFGKIGAFGFISIGELNFLKLDLNANITGMQGKTSIIPEAGLTFYNFPRRLGGIGFFAETEFTPFTFTPKGGLTIFTVFDLGFGYGIEMRQKENFKSIEGFQVSFGINIPLNFNIY
ncbi:hypothetical protein [Empedobacter sedimenti]|uniref:hypothetical protein n=1 Tax=Empedobacter sedimenti TaxID=3042610 RepID=UPI0024A6D134|nr:hypothetical protein [Empedobacter sedimenti]